MTEAGTGRSKQVLYIEDSTTSQLIVRKFLDKLGLASMTVAPSPRAAAQLLSAQGFDLILTDFFFPEGDAMGFIKHVRSSPGGRDVPIIVISSSMDEKMLYRVLTAGANDALSKPLQIEVFGEMVRRMLTQPYVRMIERPVETIRCFQWFDGERYHEFCPELNITLADPDRDRLTDQMTKILRENAANGRLLGSVSQEGVVLHNIRQ